MAILKAAPILPPESPDEIEAQFYEAMQQGDIERLMAVWADDDEIACILPGGPRVIGPQAVCAAFESVFTHGSIDIQPEAVRRHLSPGLAIHHVVERVRALTRSGPQTSYVVATNVYVRTPQGWRMAVHHASPAHDEGHPPEFTDSTIRLH